MPVSQKNRPASKTRYEYKPPEAEMRATEPNPILEAVSSGLGYLRDSADIGNIYDVATMGSIRRLLNGEPARTAPPTTHFGPGTLLMGHAPEEIHEWARGSSPFSEEPNYGNLLDPRIKAGREQGLMDVGFLADAAGGAGLAGLRKGTRAIAPVINPELNMSRREFMGNTGKAAAGLAAASAVPMVLRGVEHAAPSVVEHAAPAVMEHTAAAASNALLAPATHMEYTAARQLALGDAAARIKLWDELNPKPIYEPHLYDKDTANLKWFKERGEVIDKINKEAVAKVRSNKRYEGFKTRDDVLDDITEEAFKLRKKYGLPEDLDRYGGPWHISEKDELYLESKYPENWKERMADLNDELSSKIDNFHNNYPAYTIDNPVDEYMHFVADETDPEMIHRIKEAGGRLYDPNTHEYLHVVDGHIKFGESTPDELREFIKNAQTPKKAGGGPVTMPNNYRSGGRVRMI